MQTMGVQTGGCEVRHSFEKMQGIGGLVAKPQLEPKGAQRAPLGSSIIYIYIYIYIYNIV